VTLIGLTIGPYIEEEIDKLKRANKILGPIILDAVGSECAEEAAQYLSRFVDTEIRRSGCTPTKRFSPGYGDLQLEVQSRFYQVLKLAEIGITLLESFLMIPQKSITAFIGWRS
jgi:cobalamin-dependent methionine synthase I